MVDYYSILGVQPGCPHQEIKKAFRRKAKKIHPDVSVRKADAEEAMLLLLKAYEILGDPQRRKAYDERYSDVFASHFDYRHFLKSRPEDMFSQAKLIFYDLLHGFEEEAAELFESLQRSTGFQLENYLDSEDFMDCAFLLAEEFERRGKFLPACELLKRIVVCELERPYFRHFFEEVLGRLRILACLKMPGVVSPEVMLSVLQELSALELSGRDTAHFLKKIAEIYSDLGRYDAAEKYLRRGLKLDRRLSGINKLKVKIGYHD